MNIFLLAIDVRIKLTLTFLLQSFCLFIIHLFFGVHDVSDDDVSTAISNPSSSATCSINGVTTVKVKAGKMILCQFLRICSI